MHGDKRSEKSFLLPDSYTQRFTWIYFFYLWSNRIDLSLNSSRKSKGDLCEALLQISVYFWRWCVCVCVKTSYMVLYMGAIAKYIGWKKVRISFLSHQCSCRTWTECLEKLFENSEKEIAASRR